MSTQNRHFDCTKNKLPYNFTNENATKYSNRRFWDMAPCQMTKTYGCTEGLTSNATSGPCNDKWVKGCNPCDSYYDKPSKYFYDYKFQSCNPNNMTSKCGNPCCKPFNPCFKCKTSLDDNCCECKNSSCCHDPIIKYVPADIGLNCDNIVDFKIPPRGTKEKYLAGKFDDTFLYNNRYQCATVPLYNCCDNNIIDNMREEEWTVSDQKALVSRGIKNAEIANRFVENLSSCYYVPMNVVGRPSYYYFGSSRTSTKSGLQKQDLGRGIWNSKDYECN